MMISAGWGLFPVYRLVLDAKPDRVMLWLTRNHWACSGIFWQTRHQMSRQRHFAPSARGFLGFCFISGHRIFVTTPHYFDLSSYHFGWRESTLTSAKRPNSLSHTLQTRCGTLPCNEPSRRAKLEKSPRQLVRFFAKNPNTATWKVKTQGCLGWFRGIA